MLLSLIFLIVLVAAVVGFVFRHEVSVSLANVQQWGLVGQISVDWSHPLGGLEVLLGQR